LQTNESTEDRVSLLLSAIDQPLPELPPAGVPSPGLQLNIGSSADTPESLKGDAPSATEVNTTLVALLASSRSADADDMTCIQAQNLPSMLDSAPSLLGAAIQTATPSSSQRNAPADLIDRLQEMVALLEMPIDQLVQGEDCLHVMLDSTAERLPIDLRQVLYCVANLNFYLEEVTAASI
jgi:hypothetical protein